MGEPLASLRAELLLLRQENARLQAVRHGESPEPLVDALRTHEPLLDICREIEHLMVAFEAKLDALAAAPIEVGSQRTAEDVTSSREPDDLSPR